jgi:hypothetical protein
VLLRCLFGEARTNLVCTRAFAPVRFCCCHHPVTYQVRGLGGGFL